MVILIKLHFSFLIKNITIFINFIFKQFSDTFDDDTRSLESTYKLNTIRMKLEEKRKKIEQDKQRIEMALMRHQEKVFLLIVLIRT